MASIALARIKREFKEVIKSEEVYYFLIIILFYPTYFLSMDTFNIREHIVNFLAVAI